MTEITPTEPELMFGIPDEMPILPAGWRMMVSEDDFAYAIGLRAIAHFVSGDGKQAFPIKQDADGRHPDKKNPIQLS